MVKYRTCIGVMKSDLNPFKEIGSRMADSTILIEMARIAPHMIKKRLNDTLAIKMLS